MYQGERAVADRNMFIGEHALAGLPPAPAGLSVDMVLALDQDGVLEVWTLWPACVRVCVCAA